MIFISMIGVYLINLKKMLLKKIKYIFYKNYKMLVGFFIHILTHLIYLIELFFFYMIN